MKKTKIFLSAMALTFSLSFTAFAGDWKQDTTGWWYQNDDGSYPTNTWQVINNNSYLFDSSGYMRTGWVQMVTGDWYYLNPTGEIRYDDLTENGTTYHFDSTGICKNPTSEDNFDSNYQSLLDQEALEARNRLMNQQPQHNTNNFYEEKIVYSHDVSPATPKNRYGLADMGF